MSDTTEKRGLWLFDWSAFVVLTAMIPLALLGKDWALNLLLFQAWGVGLPCWIMLMDKNRKGPEGKGWGVPYWLSAVKAIAGTLALASLGYFVSAFALTGLGAVQYEYAEKMKNKSRCGA